ncbi:MAG: hypothetical protein ACI8PZ_001961 [Myxococcota bacterium]|jgi:hypothetical protein
MTAVLLWTRDPGARDTIPLVLSRIGQTFVRCDTLAGVVGAVLADTEPTMLVLGPSFTEEDARTIRHTLVERTRRPVTVVVLEDASDPLPPRLVLTREGDPIRLRIPVRPRTLREVVDAWRSEL